MINRCHIHLFRFDKNIDYLSYHQPFVVSYTQESSLYKILKNLHQENNSIGIPKTKDASVFVNGYIVKCTQTLNSLVEHFGDDLTIEPLNKKYSVHDLIMDEKEFEDRFNIIAPLINHDDKDIYLSLKPYFYGSRTIDVFPEYQGDALFVFASIMIEKYPDIKDEILDIISRDSTGIWSHTPFSSRFFPVDETLESCIENLQKASLLLQ